MISKGDYFEADKLEIDEEIKLCVRKIKRERRFGRKVVCMYRGKYSGRWVVK